MHFLRLKKLQNKGVFYCVIWDIQKVFTKANYVACTFVILELLILVGLDHCVLCNVLNKAKFNFNKL